MSTSGWEQALHEAVQAPSTSLRHVDIARDDDVVMIRMRFAVCDVRGEPYEAHAKMLLPARLAGEPLPLWFNCGYELADDLARRQVELNRIVVSPCDPGDEEVFPHSNPLCRGPNTDYALAHIVRGLPFIDPTRIVYAGGSAGGYAALLVAAEAFPAAAVVPNAPVVNLAYQGAYLMANGRRLAENPPAEEPLVGVLMSMFVPFIDQGWSRVYGDDVSGPAWLAHSPVAHLERITCPVAAFFSTADFLVPIEQVGVDVATATVTTLPDGLAMRAHDLTDAPAAAVRLIEQLGDDAHVEIVPVPDGAAQVRLTEIDLTLARPLTPIPIPTASKRRWLVVVADEGPTTYGIGHTRYEIQPDFEPFVRDALEVGVAVEQLTSPKLHQLLCRWHGVEWLAPGFRRLDTPEAERADVERGLRTYCALSEEHARHFADLYAVADPSVKVLSDHLLAELRSARIAVAAGSSTGRDHTDGN